ETVRKEEGADPASVAYSAVERGQTDGADVVLVDTAGRLQNKVGLMDELGKVKRLATRPLGEGHDIDEVLLVLDATTGRTACSRRRSSPRRSTSPESCSRSSTAPPRAASSWPSSASSECRSSSSDWAKAPTTSRPSPPKASSTHSSTDWALLGSSD